MCVLKTLHQKIRKFTGFQQSAAKVSTGKTVSTVPAEKKRYSISNVTVNMNLSVVCISEKRRSFDWHSNNNLLRKGHLGGIFKKIGKKFFFPMTCDHFTWTSTSDILFQAPAEWLSISISKHISFILQTHEDFWIGRKGKVSSLFWN